MTIAADGVHDGGPTFYFDFLRVAIPWKLSTGIFAKGIICL
jgi:hypothetical protein